ncbi:uncharacterized protein BDW47DRAFT_134763 [Aspergillus candidus]|uniref:XRCC4 coiled-coil domain-containing protein n=1 Tax=Aspergillus candidus TaxID=41067 RepID=A0A2I2EZJ7_ASPCN|nr:hypothetical protein BDW47DRAFT_134763 [Aspergillus candidus]PLB33788.1 hypothetical protein BDW47DRAFT_134763 [Aspergillus candidus]
MSQSTPQVLCIPRSDDTGRYVLLNVSRPKDSLFDLDVIATEGESPYTGTVRQKRLKDLRAKNYHGSDDEWIKIMSYVFGQEQCNAGQGLLSGIESSASIVGSDDEDKEMIITIRKRVQSITQRLGSLALKQNDEQAIELFDWSGVAVSRAQHLELQLSTLTDRYQAAETTIDELTKQLQDFVQTKNQHEEQLMGNFAQLLNEKKLKIRNQQRLLSSAKVDPEKLSNLETTLADGSPIQQSQTGKRGVPQSTDDVSESEDGFEKMQIDDSGLKQSEQQNEEAPAAQQRDWDDDSTTGGSALSTTDASDNEKTSGDKEAASGGPAIKKAPLVPPPRRSLPFQKRSTSDTPQVATKEDAGEGTTEGSDDDEL